MYPLNYYVNALTESYLNLMRSSNGKKKKKVKVTNCLARLNDYYMMFSNKKIKPDMRIYACESLKQELFNLLSMGENNVSKALKTNIPSELDKYIKLIAKLDYDTCKSIDRDIVNNIIDEMISNNEILNKSIISYYKNVYQVKRIQKELIETIEDNPYKNISSSISEKNYHIHVGATNTGKTYCGMQALKTSKTGVYLSPLRLLALEKQDELNKDGCICSMITGEEEDIIPFATHMSCTVELLDITKEYETAVIDECQMIGDNNRGQFWTQAILNVRAKDVYLCMAPEALHIIKNILDTTGAKYDITKHERNTPLIIQEDTYNIDTDIEPGDALIVFSRKNALILYSKLKKQGFNVSTIYGALPYSTRKLQIEKFISGETDVVVATDAIGMGLNLPIKRIVFTAGQKFDGTSVRDLKPEEIKQIAGRAGRMGIFNEGYVTATHKAIISAIKDSLKNETKDITKAYIGYSNDIVNVEAQNLFQTITIWGSIPVQKPFKKIDITRILGMEGIINTYIMSLDRREILKLIRIPFNENNHILVSLFLDYIKKYIECRDNPQEERALIFPTKYDDTLEGNETYYGMLDLYYSFSKNFNMVIDTENLIKEKEKTSYKINELLLKNTAVRTCKYCNVPLPWDYPFGQCEKCYVKRFEF